MIKRKIGDSKSFIRWIGGKQKQATKITRYFPDRTEIGIYYEPFLGGGSIFFTYSPIRAVLSDINDELMDMFIAVKSDPQKVYRNLYRHSQINTRSHYYHIRDIFNSEGDVNCFSRAAHFIYLNKAAFNGIWRENRKGEYNVPYGAKTKLIVPTLERLRQYSKMLQCAALVRSDYRDILTGCKTEDFCYIDPPYPPLSSTSNFTHYSKDRFNAKNHEELADSVLKMSKRGVRFLMSNADIPLIRSLYSSFQMVNFDVLRCVCSNGKRYRVKELLIKNY